MIVIPKKKKTENNREYAYHTLRDNIMFLRLRPGAMIGEVKLAELLGVSRTPIREAMGELKSENLVQSIPQQATMVAPINMHYVREGFLLRRLVEPNIFLQIVGTLDRSFVKKFQANLTDQFQAMEQNNLLNFCALDDEFHHLLYSAARKENIWHTRKTVTGHYDRLRFLVVQEQHINCRDIFEEHKLLFTYLLTGLTTNIEDLYEAHFGAYQQYIPSLQEALPHYFTSELAKESQCQLF